MTSIIRISILIASLAASLLLIFSTVHSEILLVAKTVTGLAILLLFSRLYSAWKSDPWIERYDRWIADDDEINDYYE